MLYWIKNFAGRATQSPISWGSDWIPCICGQLGGRGQSFIVASLDFSKKKIVSQSLRLLETYTISLINILVSKGDIQHLHHNPTLHLKWWSHRSRLSFPLSSFTLDAFFSFSLFLFLTFFYQLTHSWESIFLSTTTEHNFRLVLPFLSNLGTCLLWLSNFKIFQSMQFLKNDQDQVAHEKQV